MSAALVAAVAALLVQTGIVGGAQSLVEDRMLRVAQAFPPTLPSGYPDVVIVSIDAQSMRAYEGEWPWPRSRIAKAIRRLDEAGAKVIALDMDFSAERDATEDRALGRAIAQSGRVVLAAHREFQTVGPAEIETTSSPAPRFAKGAAAVGAALAEIDSDGIIRRGWRSRRVGGTPMQSFTEAAFSAALGMSADAHELAPYRIDYRRATPRIPTIPIVDVIEGRFDTRDIAGRIVFIGATAAEFQDLWATPLGPNRAGVWIQAVALRTRIAERAGEPVLEPVTTQLEIGFVAGLSLLAALVGSAPLVWRIVGLTALGAGVPTASFLLATFGGTLLSPVVPLGVVGAHYALGLESVRRRLGQRLQERELSLSTLFSLGEATNVTSRADGLDSGLALLADVVGASGVALMRRNENGEIDDERLTWHRGGRSDVGDIDAATLVLSDRQMRIFENAIPGRRTEGGSAIYTPLFAGENAVGVLVVEQEVARPLSELQLRTVATVGTQLALSVENSQLVGRLRTLFHSSIAALATAVEARDGYTEMHCRRLAVFSGMMAERLGLPAEEVEAIELGALLHDVGKIGISDAVLLKDGRLTQEERSHIEQHPDIGHRLVRGIDGISEITTGCVRHHHERWNGTGYPDGLAGEAIPLGARIVSLVDVWDALSSNRPYKRAYPQQRVHEILTKDSGERFEPALVDLFFEILDEQGDEMLQLIAEMTSVLEDGAS